MDMFHDDDTRVIHQLRDQIKEKNLKAFARVKLQYDKNTAGQRRLELYGRVDVAPKFNDQIAKYLDDVSKLGAQLRDLESEIDKLESSKLDVIELFVQDHQVDDDQTELNKQLEKINSEIDKLNNEIQIKESFQVAARKQITKLQELQKQYYDDAYKCELQNLDDEIDARIVELYMSMQTDHLLLVELAELSGRARFCCEKLKYDHIRSGRYVISKERAIEATELFNTMFNDIIYHFKLELLAEKYSL